MVLSVLSVYAYPDSAPVPTSALVAALDLFDFNHRATRQAVHRLASDGWIASFKDGRRSLWGFTSAGTRLMDEGSSRLERLADSDREWDGSLVVVFASVPESERARRHTLRTRMKWSGFGSIGPGIWISTEIGAERAAAAVVADLGIRSHSIVGRGGGIGHVDELIASAWDLAELEKSYRDFVDEFEGREVTSDRDAFVALTQLVHRYRRFPFEDPSLPGVLLPRNWAGQEAVRLERSLRERWWPRAKLHWAALVGG
ncbi:PaaX family transcriptional regulator C-terminal domain-containing protein [Nocardioides sp. 1609]|uniref:PaaX family transcriptional regulator n=1 Tax=Nocardioides sp. 1609 TaxID=2508327 RepID=UPI00106F3015|nr:PaaX family transcriptional regulator C-terminal domain-containing protein [Nocardioides sp. 1609]